MKLSDLKYDDVQIGLRVTLGTNINGKVVQKLDDHQNIEIELENGDSLVLPLNEMTFVTVLLNKSQIVE